MSKNCLGVNILSTLVLIQMAPHPIPSVADPAPGVADPRRDKSGDTWSRAPGGPMVGGQVGGPIEDTPGTARSLSTPGNDGGRNIYIEMVNWWSTILLKTACSEVRN